jgi:O-antigen/teichoic acid export membrane protein
MAQPSFLRHAAVYGLGHMLLYVGGIILLPLYTRCLRPEEYGVLELLSRVGEILTLCLLYNALRQASITFYNQAPDEAERRRVSGTLLLLLVIIGAVGFLLALLCAGPVSGALDLQDDDLLLVDVFRNSDLLLLAVLAAMLEGTTVALLALPQARTESRFFVTVSASQLVLKVVLCVWLVGGMGWGVRGVLWGAVLTSSVFVIFLSLREWLTAGLCWDRHKLREYVSFCLPFLPGGLCLFVLNSGDRFLLNYYGGAAAVGVYALGYKLGALVTTFSVTPLLMVWGARMYDAARREDAPEVFGRVTTHILGAYLLVGLAVCLFQDEIIALLGRPSYRDAAQVIAPVVLAFWFLSAVSLMDAGFYIQRRTGRKTWVTVAASVVVLVLYATLIPTFGGLGAAAATVGGFVFQAVLTRGVVQRLFYVRYEDRRLAFMLGTAIMLWAVSRLLPVGIGAAPLKIALWMLWPILLWVTGVIAEDEKRWVWEIVALVRTRKEGETHDGESLSGTDDAAAEVEFAGQVRREVVDGVAR